MKQQQQYPLLVAKENWKKAYSTWYSQAVSHPSTNQAQPRLASEIGRDRACSGWYGRKRRTRATIPYLYMGKHHHHSYYCCSVTVETWLLFWFHVQEKEAQGAILSSYCRNKIILIFSNFRQRQRPGFIHCFLRVTCSCDMNKVVFWISKVIGVVTRFPQWWWVLVSISFFLLWWWVFPALSKMFLLWSSSNSTLCWLQKKIGKKLTAPGIPRRSPIQVLTRPNPA